MEHILNWQGNFWFLVKERMNNLLYVIAVILIVGWLIGMLDYNSGWLIHLMLLSAAVCLVLRLLLRRKRKSQRDKNG